MKIIDEKGKLFGKINIIDLLFIVIIAVAVIGGVNRFKDSSVVAESTDKGTFELLVEPVRQPSVDAIEVGDEFYDFNKGVYMGKVIDKRVENYTQETDYEGKWVRAEIPGYYSVYLTLEGDVTQTARSYQVGGEEIRVGVEYRVKSKRSAFTGVCIGVNIEE